MKYLVMIFLIHLITKQIYNYQISSKHLNIAETSRQLHMHRNTLIYRLDQVEKKTGLDLRKFEDAMTFKLASMVINYYIQKEFLT